jgi:biotin carboxyl carrier protein
VQGTVVRMLVDVGDRVPENADVCIIEAMKMENVVQTDLAGHVAEIRVSPGDTVDPGSVIAVIRADPT